MSLRAHARLQACDLVCKKRHPAGSVQTVWYDPDDPRRCEFEQPSASGLRVLIIIWGAVLGVSGCCACCACCSVCLSGPPSWVSLLWWLLKPSRAPPASASVARWLANSSGTTQERQPLLASAAASQQQQQQQPLNYHIDVAQMSSPYAFASSSSGSDSAAIKAQPDLPASAPAAPVAPSAPEIAADQQTVSAYTELVRLALVDGQLSAGEASLLASHRAHHGISDAQHQAVLREPAAACATIHSFARSVIKQALLASARNSSVRRCPPPPLCSVIMTGACVVAETMAAPSAPELEARASCVICQSHRAEFIVLDCMHVCLCADCASKPLSACPVCRAAVRCVRKTFQS